MNPTVPRRTSLSFACAGLFAWLGGVAGLQLDWPTAIFLFAPFCLTPLTLSLAGFDLSKRMKRLSLFSILAAAIVLPISFAFSPGGYACLFAIPWALCCVVIALIGGLRMLRCYRAYRCRRNLFADPRIFEAIGMMFLAVGGGWLVMSRLGVRPLGFSSIIVFATAIHFHYAGFILPIIAAKVVARRRGRLALVGGWGIVGGVPAVAVGITLSAWEIYVGEWIATWWLAGACLIIAFQQIQCAIRQSTIQKWLLIGSSASLIVSMILAGGYAMSRCGIIAWLDIPLMIVTHGVLNAFGFALLGLLGWSRKNDLDVQYFIVTRFTGEQPADKPFSPNLSLHPAAQKV